MRSNCPDYEHRGDAECLHADDASSSETAGTGQCSGRTTRDALEATIGRAFHRRVLQEIAHVSQNYPALSLVLTENKISIPCTPPGGFVMSIETDRGRYVVRLGDWRDEFALVGEAVELLEAALRGEIRLRVEIGENGRYCTAERILPNGEWLTLPRHEEWEQPTGLNKPHPGDLPVV